MVFTASPKITIPLSALMIVFATMILGIPDELLDVSKKAPFTSWRNSKGEFFAARRVQDAFIHYYLLHALPATIWSILMPLQYWDKLRKSQPTMHRICGYIIASCSLCLTLSGLAFIPRSLSYSAPTFSMHKVYGTPAIPSFNSFAAFIAAPLMLVTGSRAIYLARNKRFAEHRRWAVYHGIAGYLISIQRVWILVLGAAGQLLQASPELQSILRTDRLRSLKAISEAETAAFAFTTWAAGFTTLAWFLYVQYQNASPVAASKVKKL